MTIIAMGLERWDARGDHAVVIRYQTWSLSKIFNEEAYLSNVTAAS